MGIQAAWNGNCLSSSANGAPIFQEACEARKALTLIDDIYDYI